MVFGILTVVIVILVFMLVGRGGEGGQAGKQNTEDGIQETGHGTQGTEQGEQHTEASVAFDEIDMYYDGTRLPAGFARRGTEDAKFVHAMVLDLPAIDPAIHYYEGWLVKPGITEYFSTGSLFAREDGKFGLIYEVPLEEAPEDILDYARVVVTRELFDGDLSPSPAHIAEGEFLK